MRTVMILADYREELRQHMSTMRTGVMHAIFFFLTYATAHSVKEAEVKAVNLKVAHYLGLNEVPDFKNVS